MGVGSADLLQLILQVLDQLVLPTLDLFYRLGDGSDCLTVDMGSLEHLIELQILDLQLLGNC